VQHVDYLYGIIAEEQGQQHGDGETTGRLQRDIPGMLWKTCFYAQISEFRSALKKHTSRLALLSAAAAGAAGERPEDERRERLYVAQLTEAFLKFLSDSVAFYQKMILEVRQQRSNPSHYHDALMNNNLFLRVSSLKRERASGKPCLRRPVVPS
jgi:hypothetical protein